jgi:hypothetical protein
MNAYASWSGVSATSKSPVAFEPKSHFIGAPSQSVLPTVVRAPPDGSGPPPPMFIGGAAP